MNYKDFTLGDWIGHISGAIEDERELDGNEMRDLVEFLTTLNQEPILDKARAEIADLADCDAYGDVQRAFNNGLWRAVEIIDKCKEENQWLK